MTTEDIDRQCPRNLNATGINDLNWQQAPFDDACLRVSSLTVNQDA